jgi:hypothetical protein
MKSVVHSNIVRALTQLSDRELQENLWLASEGQFSSFTEAIEELYSDSSLLYELERGNSPYGPPADDMLILLNKELDKIDSGRHPRLIIADPQMDRIRELARDILKEIT